MATLYHLIGIPGNQMATLYYVIGIPGAGKTSLLNAALAGVPYQAVDDYPARRVYPGGVLLGRERGVFSGTDSYPYNVQPVVLEWLVSCGLQRVLGEGDRLANDRFFRGVVAAGWNLSVIYLNTPPALAAERRKQRGSNQNLAWVKGRITKVHSLAARYASWELDGSLSLLDLAKAFRTTPFMREFRGDI